MSLADTYHDDPRDDRPDHQRDHRDRPAHPHRSDLYGIGCAGPAACYAMGDDGTILALG